jgi:hypothetical protein
LSWVESSSAGSCRRNKARRDPRFRPAAWLELVLCFGGNSKRGKNRSPALAGGGGAIGRRDRGPSIGRAISADENFRAVSVSDPQREAPHRPSGQALSRKSGSGHGEVLELLPLSCAMDGDKITSRWIPVGKWQ